MKLRMMSPDMIIEVIIGVIIFGVGVYAVFTTVSSLPQTAYSATGHQNALVNATYKNMQNVTTTSNNVFNVVGIVLIIGAIMTIIGVVLAYVQNRQ